MNGRKQILNTDGSYLCGSLGEFRSMGAKEVKKTQDWVREYRYSIFNYSPKSVHPVMLDELVTIQVEKMIDKSISHGTLRPQDLIPTFIEALKLIDLFGDCKAIIEEGERLVNGTRVDWDSREVQDYLAETLFDVLNSFAPIDASFSSHIGDGSDFGFWRIELDDLSSIDEEK